MIRVVALLLIVFSFESRTFADDRCNQLVDVVAEDGVTEWKLPPGYDSCHVINQSQEVKLHFLMENIKNSFMNFNRLSRVSWQEFSEKLKKETGLSFLDYPVVRRDNGQLLAVGNWHSQRLIGFILGTLIRIRMLFDLKVEDYGQHPQSREEFIPYQPTPPVEAELRQMSKVLKEILMELRKLKPNAFLCNLMQIMVPTSVIITQSENDVTWRASDVLDKLVSNSVSVGLNGEMNPNLENSYVQGVMEDLGLLDDAKVYNCQNEDSQPSVPESIVESESRCTYIGLERVINLDTNPLRLGIHSSGAGQGDCSFIGATWEGTEHSISHFTGRLVSIEGENKFIRIVECSKVAVQSSKHLKLKIKLNETSCRVKAPPPIMREIVSQH